MAAVAAECRPLHSRSATSCSLIGLQVAAASIDLNVTAQQRNCLAA